METQIIVKESKQRNREIFYQLHHANTWVPESGLASLNISFSMPWLCRKLSKVIKQEGEENQCKTKSVSCNEKVRYAMKNITRENQAGMFCSIVSGILPNYRGCSGRSADIAKDVTLNRNVGEIAFPSFSCSICRKEFVSINGLANHNIVPCYRNSLEYKETERPSTLKKNSLSCGICKKTFVSNEALMDHNTVPCFRKFPMCEKGDKEGNHHSNSISTSTTTENNECETFSCCVCKKKFGSIVEFRDHNMVPCFKEHMEHGCTPRLLAHPLRLKTVEVEKVVMCDICNKTFANDSYLKSHVITHTFPCIICGNKYKTKRSLKRHLLNQHPYHSKYHSLS